MTLAKLKKYVEAEFKNAEKMAAETGDDYHTGRWAAYKDILDKLERRPK